ncbi:ribokinase [Natronincola ferrireducens]|uniref:Ribokinase n=1 Tax=Natronincola ferrireducens TaxID=393762 RepID=A0A1G9GIB8_9FIRM|nr:ribokinase [Natronincola ferrireducens]SDL00439.1 ribokinase [Natronincola ferrireducens]
MGILSFGSLNVDETYHVEAIALPGQTIPSKRMSISSGGKGFNQSIAAAKAGAKVYHAGAIGKKDADIIRGILEDNNVNTTYISTNHEHSGRALIQCDKNGENCIVLYGGANHEIDKEYIDRVMAKFEKKHTVLLQNEISNTDYIMIKAKEKGMQICFNPSPISEALYSYPMELIDILILNELEGRDITKEFNKDKILDVLLKKYPSMKIVLTLGENGCIYADKDQRIPQSAYKVVTIDTTAAGDTFIGYYISTIMSGYDTRKALKIATAASALAVTKEGAAKSIPTMKEVKDFMMKFKDYTL